MNRPENFPFVTTEISILARKNNYSNIKAPIQYYQLIDWFREEHQIHIIVEPIVTQRDNQDIVVYDYYLASDKEDWEEWDRDEFFDDYYTALIEAIKEAFKSI